MLLYNADLKVARIIVDAYSLYQPMLSVFFQPGISSLVQ